MLAVVCNGKVLFKNQGAHMYWQNLKRVNKTAGKCKKTVKNGHGLVFPLLTEVKARSWI